MGIRNEVNMDIYRIADLNIGVCNHSDFTKKYMKDYLTENAEPDFVVEVTDEMITYEKTVALEETPEKYYEITAVLREICKKIVSDYDGFFLPKARRIFPPQKAELENLPTQDCGEKF